MLPQTSTFWIFMVVLYLVVILGVSGLISEIEKKKKNDSDLLRADLSWPLLVMTYTASMMSTYAFLAGPGIYYRNGIGHFLEEMSYFVMFLIICRVVMDRIWIASRGKKFETPSDFFDFRFKSPVLRIVLGIVFLMASFPYIASVFGSIARAIVQISGGALTYQACVWIVGGIVVFFTVVGGMNAVAWSDTIQGVVYIGMIWLVVGVALKIGFNGSLTEAIATVSEKSQTAWFSMPGPSGAVTYNFRLGKSLSTAIGYTVMQPHVFVRAGYASNNIETQRKLSYMGPILQVVVWGGVMLIGMLGFALLPGLEGGQTELVIPLLAEQVVQSISPVLASVIILGFFIGIMGVGVSTADSFLLVASAIVYRDFFDKVLKIKLDPAKEIKRIRAVITIIGIISIVLALKPPALMHTLILFSVAIVMPLFPILLYGMFWKRATKEAAIVSAIVGTILVIMTYSVWHVGDTFYGIIGAAAAIILMPVISLMTPDRSSDADDMIESYNKNFKEVYNVRGLEKEVRSGATK